MNFEYLGASVFFVSFRAARKRHFVRAARGRLRAAAGVLALAIALTFADDASAHRRDEYLQAARVAILPDRVDVELDLTPGIALADGIIAAVDRDHSGSLSADEQDVYVRQVLSAVALRLDDTPIGLEVVSATFPQLDAFRGGEGTIMLRVRARLTHLADGAHHLWLHNTHDRPVSVYLANALVPESERIAIGAQRRDQAQSELTIDFAVRPASMRLPATWLLGGLGGVGLAFLLRRS